MSLLHQIGDFLRNELSLVPLIYIRGLFIAILMILLLWVLKLPNTETTPPDAKATWANNLKTWTVIALLLQIFMYSLF